MNKKANHIFKQTFCNPDRHDFCTAYLILTKSNINCKPLADINLRHCKHR